MMYRKCGRSLWRGKPPLWRSTTHLQLPGQIDRFMLMNKSIKLFAEDKMDQQEYISIKHLAEILGMDRSHARRYVLKLGIKPQKRRTVDSANQLTLTVTSDEADVILKNREDQGFTGTGKVVELECGVFYVIQLVPELDSKRIKMGFAADLNDRLAQHRTAAPTASIIKSWPCKRVWEVTVMDSLASVKCRHILNEVYECDDLEHLISRGDQLFELLPDPKNRPDLSDYSPLKK